MNANDQFRSKVKAIEGYLRNRLPVYQFEPINLLNRDSHDSIYFKNPNNSEQISLEVSAVFIEDNSLKDIRKFLINEEIYNYLLDECLEKVVIEYNGKITPYNKNSQG